MAARSSSDRACWRRATSSARRKHASASTTAGDAASISAGVIGSLGSVRQIPFSAAPLPSPCPCRPPQQELAPQSMELCFVEPNALLIDHEQRLSERGQPFLGLSSLSIRLRQERQVR